MSVALPFLNLPQNLQWHVRSYAAWLLLIATAAAYYPRFVKLPVGMETYPQAASCLWHGQMLQVCDQGFTYPPFFALVMLPFAPLPLWLRDFVWYGVTLAVTIGAFKLCETVARKSLAAPLERAELFWLRFFALLLSAKLILAVFENQAYDALVLVAVLLGLSALREDRPLAAGASLALAAALKATPLIFLPYLLWKRYFAAAAAFVLVYALASLLPDLLFAPAGGPGYFATWLGEVAGPSLGVNPAGAPFAFWDGANILNHSLRGAVALNVDEAHYRGLFDVALAVADGCFIVVVGTLLAVSPRRPQSIAIDGSLLLIAMLMLSPMTSRSHYVALLLPYMTLLAHNWRDQRTGRLGRAVLLMSFALVTLAGNDAVGEAFTVWAYRHSAMVLGTLVLLIYFAALVIKRQVNSSGNLLGQPLVPAKAGTPRFSEASFRSQSGLPLSRE
ncbi:MAG TPA: glycosyltransferase family 87 protein [Xanthobacteraceae bacterium]|nr:glycosyltransferase family 87 protein [Xanthobacteraceae bacterium]